MDNYSIYVSVTYFMDEGKHISNVSISETCCYLWIREYIKTLNVVWIMHLRIYALGFIHLELVLMIMESIYLSSIYMCNLFIMLNEP